MKNGFCLFHVSSIPSSPDSITHVKPNGMLSAYKKCPNRLHAVRASEIKFSFLRQSKCGRPYSSSRAFTSMMLIFLLMA